MTLRKRPDDSEVGGEPSGVFARAGYFWTPWLETEFEAASQAESWNPDYALEYLVRSSAGGRFEVQTIQLKHDYTTGRWTVAQLLQIRRLRFVQPYVGAGAGMESQTITDSRHESVPYLSETLPPNATPVDKLPTEFGAPVKTRHAIGFAEAGVKVFVGRRAYFALDWTFAGTSARRVNGGFGVELF